MFNVKYFKEFNFLDIEKYGMVDKIFEKILLQVYNENIINRGIPMDVIADIIGVMSYKKFMANYVKETNNDELYWGEIQDIMTDEIYSKENISNNNINSMKEYKVAPLAINDFEFIFVTPEVDLDVHKSTKFKLLVSTIQHNILKNDTRDLRIVIKRCSNKLFINLLRFFEGLDPISEKDIIFTNEERLNVIFLSGIMNKASDIFLDSKKDGIDVSFQIYNDLKHFKKYNLNRIERNNLLDAVFKLAGVDPAKIEWTTGTKDFKIDNLGGFEKPKYEGRVNVVNTNNGISPAIRIHGKETTSLSLKELNINPGPKQRFRELLNNRSGIIILGGAKGQGKSTTILAALDTLQSEMPHLRIEEMSAPVEVDLPGISQLSLNQDLKVDFEELKRSATRRNAKINYIGEINDLSSVDFVVGVASQECLVISTIHAESTSMIPMRVKGLSMPAPGLYEQFIELSKGYAHQVMMKQACQECSKVIKVSELGQRDRDILQTYEYDSDEVFIEGSEKRQCPYCQGLGFIIDKPIVTLEVIQIDEDTKDLIRDSLNNPRLVIEKLVREKGISGISDALYFLKIKKVTYDMIYRSYQLQNMRTSDIISHRRSR